MESTLPELIGKIFGSDAFMPHGHCYLWEPDVLWLNVASDAVIGVSYYSIPLALWTFVRRRHDLAFPGVFRLFTAFIAACGTTHLVDIWTVWTPIYRLEGVIKFATALISAATAVVLWPLIPKALALPNPSTLEEANRRLRAEVEERQKVEGELRRLNAELEKRVNSRTSELQRSNEDLEQFAYVASHDLQEPLQVVSNSVGMLELRYSDKLDEKAKRYVQFALKGTERMKTLIDDLLAYSRAGTSKQRRAHVSADFALKHAIENLRAAVERCGAELSYGALPEVYADTTQLVQIFQNLLSNAIKYHRRTEQPKVTVGCVREGGFWKFSVTDRGIGVAPEHREEIFEAFRRLHPYDDYPGSGIGLAICKRLVERHGGTLWMTSEVGVGSTFYFTLPADSADSEGVRASGGGELAR